MFEQGDAAMELKVIDRMVEEMHVATMVCGHILQDEKSPFEPYYSGFRSSGSLLSGRLTPRLRFIECKV